MSSLEPLREQIAAWFNQDVNGVVIHAALKRDHGFVGSYSSVRRMLGTLKREQPPDTTVRLVFAPDEAAQVDFADSRSREQALDRIAGFDPHCWKF